jgi:uncharacterized protein
MLDYFALIQKYIKPDSQFYRIYVPHVVMVTQKALAIANAKGLNEDSLTFIEEAGMLHDIGIIKINAPKLGVTSDLPYICHGTEGSAILEAEGLPRHALVAERHTGVGITLAEIVERDLPIPHRSMEPQSIEEKIISYADLFFSKSPHKLWFQETPDEIAAELSQFGEAQVAIFRAWQAEFEPSSVQ